MDEPSILLRVEDAVATVTLNRPAALNALDLRMAEALAEACEECEEHQGVRAVVLTGAGRGFCAGGDMRAAFGEVERGGDPEGFFRDLTVPLHRAILSLRRMPKPVVAAINGAAGGAGMSLAAACDLRLAAEGARFKQAYTSIGLTPDGGWTAIVPQLVGASIASELLFLDPVIDAAEALRLGLVHQVVPERGLMARVGEVSRALADGPSTAFAGAKALLNAWLLPALEAQLDRERQRIIGQGATGDFREGVVAFVEKRRPRFPASREP